MAVYGYLVSQWTAFGPSIFIEDDMAAIYLIHPTHGAKVAISEEEAISDEMYGWERYNPDTPYEEADVDDDYVNEMAAPKRRGRPRATQDD